MLNRVTLWQRPSGIREWPGSWILSGKSAEILSSLLAWLMRQWLLQHTAPSKSTFCCHFWHQSLKLSQQIVTMSYSDNPVCFSNREVWMIHNEVDPLAKLSQFCLCVSNATLAKGHRSELVLKLLWKVWIKFLSVQVIFANVMARQNLHSKKLLFLLQNSLLFPCFLPLYLFSLKNCNHNENILFVNSMTYSYFNMKYQWCD